MNRAEARKKAKELVGKMTIEEKASQLRYDAPAIKRLGIPTYNWWNEALHGVARAGVATMFPQAIGMAATFDRTLIEEVADAIAIEGRAKYNAYSAENDRDIYKGLTFWSPNVNIFRDPRWGRGHETYGEDPFLSATLGVSFVKGLQGDGETMKAAACAKHFAVHSGPEALRHEFNAVVSQKDLYETYLPAFEALVKEANVEAVMGAYNRTNGEPCCGSKTLIQDILRGDWKFEGHFVSDCWALRDFHEHHHVTATMEESATMALKAGCDLNCGNTYLHLLKAYQDGMITEEDITLSAERLFTTRYLLGLFDGSEYDSIPYEAVECKKHIELAAEVARKSAVLLKNDGILPLKKEAIRTIGVIGPNADSRAALIGNYHGTSSEYITVLDGIRQAAGNEIRIFYSEGSHLFQKKTENLAWENDRIAEAVITAKQSDVVVLCLGLDEQLEGEEGDDGNHYASGDKADLSLPFVQQRLLEAVLKVQKPTVICVLAGSALDLSYANEHANAILQLWYPGARGGKTVGELLFGQKFPSGKLPVTFYKNLEDLPEFEDYSMSGRTYRYLTVPPLYPFGYGLSYSKIKVTNASVSASKYREEGARVSVALANLGDYDTEEVVQIYLKNEDSQLAVPNPVLCGYQRVEVLKGQEKSIEIQISPDAFRVVDQNGNRVFDGDRYSIYVGTSQPDKRSVELTGEAPIKIELSVS